MKGNPIKGFALENANEIIGNEIEKVVSWQNDSNLKSSNGKSVRLRFVMKDADLYSIKFN